MTGDPLLFHDRGANEALLSQAKGRCRCREDRAATMTASGKCYACDGRERGMPETEGHHLFGPQVPIVVDLPLNEHRVLDALRLARYPLLVEPGSNTLMNIAGLLMQFAELAEMQVAAAERRRAPQWTGALADILADKGREAAETLLLLDGWLGPERQSDPEAPQWAPYLGARDQKTSEKPRARRRGRRR